MIYDIAVIGLGPAGASFARLVDSQKYKVIAFDKKDACFPDRYAKPCGGLLSPDALRALSRFGLPIPGEVIASPQIFYVKTIDMDRGLTRNYSRFYLNIDRQKFDHWLVSLIPQSVTVYGGSTVTGIRKTGDAYEVNYRHDGLEYTITAKYVVGADGARSIVSKTFVDPNRKNLLLSIQEWFSYDSQNAFFSCVFDRQNSGSYSWSLSKNGYFIFGGAYDIHRARDTFEQQKATLIAYGVNLPEPVRREACFVKRLRSVSDIRLGAEEVLLLGEAAGFISPSSFEGISGALNSAYQLSRVFNAGRTDILRGYRKAAWKMRLKYTLKIFKASVLCNRFLRGLIMKSGIKSIRLV